MKKKYLIPLILVLIFFQSCSNFPEIATDTIGRNEKAMDKIKTLPVYERFSFVVFGDNREGYDIYKKIVALANELDPLFIVNTGDLVPDGSYSSYMNFLSMSEPLKAPYLVCAGNHDIRNNGRKFFRSIFGPSDYFFDYSNCRFIIVDNSGSYLTDSQLAWLDRNLKTDKHKFIFMHYPPAIGNLYGVMTYNNKTFQKIIERNNVDYVFCGHIHCYDRYVKNGVTYVITGGAGASYRNTNDITGEYVNHLMVVEVNGDEIKDSIVRLGTDSYKPPKPREKFSPFKRSRKW